MEHVNGWCFRGIYKGGLWENDLHVSALKPCISVIQLISCVSSLPHVSSTCSNCQGEFTNLVDHCIHECIYLNRQRERFCREIFSLGPDIFMYFHMQDKLTLTNLLLGVESPELLQILSESSDNFKTSCILNIHSMWLAYKASKE